MKIPRKKQVVDNGGDSEVTITGVSRDRNCSVLDSSVTSTCSRVSSYGVPQEFLWGDWEEVDEDELVKAAIARSLDNQQNKAEDMELSAC